METKYLYELRVTVNLYVNNMISTLRRHTIVNDTMPNHIEVMYNSEMRQGLQQIHKDVIHKVVVPSMSEGINEDGGIVQVMMYMTSNDLIWAKNLLKERLKLMQSEMEFKTKQLKVLLDEGCKIERKFEE